MNRFDTRRYYIICISIIVTLLIAIAVTTVLVVSTSASETVNIKPAQGMGRNTNVAQNAFNEPPEEIEEESTNETINETIEIHDIADTTPVTEESVDEYTEEIIETETEEPTVTDGLGEIQEAIQPEPVMFDDELSRYVLDICNGYGVDYALVMAIIEKESNFDVNNVGDNGNSLGLMQIQPRWHTERMSELDCWDLMDPYQNIKVGVHYLAELFADGYSVEGVLMAYNGGRSYANSLIERGVVSDYALTVLDMKGKY